MTVSTAPPAPDNIQCEAAMSDDVLQASRAAITKHLGYADRRWAPERWISNLPEKQQPLVPLLIALLDATQSVANAINDNAHDDGQPLQRGFSHDLAHQAEQVAAVIRNAADAADLTGGWGLPSMSGKELV
jgi:hypothetical protein